MFVFSKSARTGLAVAVLALQSSWTISAQAASSENLVNAIKQAKIFQTAVNITAFTDGDQVKVSTYLNAKATDQDCKIDSILISKAVMDAAPEVTRCKVYFYNSANLREFKEVSVTSAEVKGFATGAISKDTILASLAVTSRHAAVTSDEMIAAIKNSGVVSPDARITARLNGDQASVSTYRNRKANDQDCKIDAILISKVLLDLAPNDIARCSAYFFDSKDLSSYKQVQVTAGNVKAFGEGAIEQDKLLASLPIKEGQIADPAAKVSDYLDEGQGAGLSTHVETAINGNELNISTTLSPAISDHEAKLKAFMLAQRALSITPPTVTTMKVRFDDPGRKEAYREVVFGAALIKSLIASLDNALGSVGVVSYGRSQDTDSGAAVAGIMQTERQSLLDRIKDLEKKGVGVSPFYGAFKAIETDIPGGDQSKISDAIKRLAAALDTQEKSYKDAKERPVSKPPVVAASTNNAPAKPHTGPRLSRYDALGNMPITNSEILRDPDKVVAKVDSKLRSEGINPQQSISMYKALLYVAQVLSDSDRASDGAKFDQMAASLRAAYPKLR